MVFYEGSILRWSSFSSPQGSQRYMPFDWKSVAVADNDLRMWWQGDSVLFRTMQGCLVCWFGTTPCILFFGQLAKILIAPFSILSQATSPSPCGPSFPVYSPRKRETSCLPRSKRGLISWLAGSFGRGESLHSR